MNAQEFLEKTSPGELYGLRAEYNTLPLSFRRQFMRIMEAYADHKVRIALKFKSNQIKEYVRSLNTPDNVIYKDNELLIQSCFASALEILEGETQKGNYSKEEITERLERPQVNPSKEQ